MAPTAPRSMNTWTGGAAGGDVLHKVRGVVDASQSEVGDPLGPFVPVVVSGRSRVVPCTCRVGHREHQSRQHDDQDGANGPRNAFPIMGLPSAGVRKKRLVACKVLHGAQLGA
jgi:hypothetical protein